MATVRGMRIAIQVGSELRITNNGEVIVDNPEIEVAGEPNAADASSVKPFMEGGLQTVFGQSKKSHRFWTMEYVGAA